MFTGWKVAVVAVAASMLIGSITLYIHGAEQAKARNIVLEADKAELIRKNQTAQTAVNACMGVNLENYNNSLAQQKRADEAVANSVIRDKEADDEVAQIRHDAPQIGHDQCPAIDDDFRKWVFGK